MGHQGGKLPSPRPTSSSYMQGKICYSDPFNDVTFSYYFSFKRK